MCKAELNVSLNECQHRWYHLLRPCIPGGNLNSCPGKLAIEGWEIRCDFCPFCSSWPLENGEFLLFGGSPHSRSSSISTPLSRTPSLSTTVNVARKDSKRSNLARSGSETSISNAALGSPVFSAGEKNKALNSRVDTYFESQPENLLEARSRRTLNSGWGGLPRADETEEEKKFDRRSSESTNSSNTVLRDAVGSKAAKAWRAARRRSKDVTSFFR
ncbi:uncharacterized protein PV09_00981 [Verruconis gallopava]|uniref:Uncharacterized protein n=1 Tax=Verruconis gallopava TaxID=253628 RepID=A0A0D1Z520_9PEZI|nr:uncharacterized protein PV09_00981 [Verruconis gallopava]KIW08037.1 hypothetical protein PV09_00981 [Verruconis gallopava]